jgi:hypothetical protein
MPRKPRMCAALRPHYAKHPKSADGFKMQGPELEHRYPEGHDEFKFTRNAPSAEDRKLGPHELEA